MKKMYAFFVTIFTLLSISTAFSQDIYFSAIGARNTPDAAPATSGTLTTNASPQLDLPLRNYATITSFQYGFENPTTIGGPGGGGGKTQLNAITITKNVDQSSNRLMQAGLANTALTSAQILIVKNTGAGKTSTVYKIDLKNAFITNFTASAGAGTGCTDGCVGESFTIVYAAIQVTTYSQDSSGAVTANPPATWNQTTNSANF